MIELKTIEKLKEMQVLFFCLIPVGILILIFSIKVVQRTFFGNIILEIPYSQKSAEFILGGFGTYTIWHKGQFFRKAPLDEFKPEIFNKTTGQRIRLYSSLFRPNSNNGKTAIMQLYRFSAPAGRYSLELTEGSGISLAENSLICHMPFKMVDFDKYFIQVRESQQFFIVLAGILLIVLSGFCIIGGLVVGILADQIFK